MTATWVGLRQGMTLAITVGALIGLSLSAHASASAPEDTPIPTRCASESADSQDVRQGLTSLVDWLLPQPTAKPRPNVDCLTTRDGPPSDRETQAPRLGIQPDQSAEEVPLNMNYTLSGLVQHQAPPSTNGVDSEFELRIGENISLLASHLDVTQQLMRAALEVSGTSSPTGSFDEHVPQELALQLGDTTLEAKADFMSGLTQYLARSLTNADVPLPESGDDVTLVFNMSGGVSGLDVSTVLEQTRQRHDVSDPLNVGEITVKISNGNVTSEAALDPADDSIQLKAGKFAVDYHFGSNTLTSTTTFSRGQGVEEQRFQLTAELGSVDFTGQALLFDNSGQQEFKLEAFWDGLTFSTLLTPQGFQESSLGLDLEF